MGLELTTPRSSIAMFYQHALPTEPARHRERNDFLKNSNESLVSMLDSETANQKG